MNKKQKEFTEEMMKGCMNFQRETGARLHYVIGYMYESVNYKWITYKDYYEILNELVRKHII